MNQNIFPIDLYLERTGLSGLGGTTALDLKKLVTAQLYGISFENLDVVSERPISLSPEVIVEKILHQKRGGYCYELNGLLGLALEKAGFIFKPRLARVTYNRPTPGPKTHLVFVVKADGLEWLVDVGFGGPGLISPLPFKAGAEAEQNGVRFRLVEAENNDLHLQRQTGSEWINLYIVSGEEVLPIDIEVVNHFISTWERSPFKSLLICVAHDESGLTTFQGQAIIKKDHQLQEKGRIPVLDATDLRNKMLQHFQTKVPSSICEKVWKKISTNASA